MPFTSALSTAHQSNRAAEETGRAILAKLKRNPDLAIAFFSPHHAANIAEMGSTLHQELGAKAFLGVLGESIVSGSKEIENQPAVSVWGATWDSTVAIDAFHLDLEETPDGPTLFGWPDAMLDVDPANSLLVCFGDPYTFPAVELFLPRVNEDNPGLPVSGGMASNPTGRGMPSLILNGEVQDCGAVGVLIRGAKHRMVVSQGCRPIGRPMIVTKGQDNVIAEIGGQTPHEYLRGLLSEASEHDRGLMQRGLLIGLAISEYRDEFRPGDFLIRSLVGLDPRTGALAVTDRIRRGQTVQFQVRDEQTAGEDLRELLIEAQASGFVPSGALAFLCNGRGTRMFGEADHDARIVQQVVGPLPLAGFFAAGEFGPIGGKNFIHGFTASTILFA